MSKKNEPRPQKTQKVSQIGSEILALVSDWKEGPTRHLNEIGCFIETLDALVDLLVQSQDNDDQHSALVVSMEAMLEKLQAEIDGIWSNLEGLPDGSTRVPYRDHETTLQRVLDDGYAVLFGDVAPAGWKIVGEYKHDSLGSRPIIKRESTENPTRP